ncbi:hypothetical protein PQD09_gp73 [Providencia phage PSTCR4]|uniref:Uncharacterized protein n=1 Tax=Providencia phage PSTCR4 TaxID=2783546 RepID=A0A873WTA8_9CAUD|nr:hypothetical protein PQD09_gp73 [Providencia phage PSTCR4]QPB12094.1 hypothetical protein [Providencia phage PSTCR4]
MHKVEDLLSKFSYFKAEEFNSDARRDKDFQCIEKCYHNNGSYLFVHKQSMFDEVVLEIHKETDSNSNVLPKPISITTALTPSERYDLAIYFLGTINVMGK